MPDMRPSHAFAALAGLVWMVLLWPVLAVVAWGCALVMTLLRGEPPDQLAHETLRAMVSEGRGAGLVLMSLLVVLVTPVIEEVLYRGLLQDAIRRVGFGRWPAIVTASLCFSFMHWDAAAPHALLALFVLSLGLGWAYEKTGRLSAAIAMHVLFNLGNLILALALT